jgi:predicted CXXCH cytochrome family protein
MRRAAPAIAAVLGLHAVLASLATCRGGPPVRPLHANDRDRLIWLMGGIDAHLLEVQWGAADPVQPAYVRPQLAGMREKFERALQLNLPYDTFAARAREAIETIRELEKSPWTPEMRDDGYATLRAMCAGCHRAFAPPNEVAVVKPRAKEACGGCHPRIYEEWQETLHAKAWIDPVYRMSAGNPPRLECRGCHSMEPVLARELSTDLSYRPVFRPYNHEDGVSCLSCHGLADGSVAAARDVPGAPCRPRRDDRLKTPEFCGACHNPSHSAYDEWKRSKSGKSCVGCHASKEGKFTHRMRGCDDPEFVKSGLDWSCDVAGGMLRVTLTNRSGHKLPSEVPTRLLRVRVRLDEREEEVLFRRPMKQIVGERDNRLWPDETRVLAWPASGVRRVKVEILFQPSLLVPPHGWITIGRWEREL